MTRSRCNASLKRSSHGSSEPSVARAGVGLQRLPPLVVYAAVSPASAPTGRTRRTRRWAAKQEEGYDGQATTRGASDAIGTGRSVLGRDGAANRAGDGAGRNALPLADHGRIGCWAGGCLPRRSGSKQARAADELGGVQPRRWLDP